MAFSIHGAGAAVAEVGAFAAKGLHSIAKPQDYGTFGAYAFEGVTGAIAAGMAANGELFQARWSDATRFCLITALRITGIRATTAFVAGVIDIKATIARAWTVNGTGGTLLTLSGDNQKLRASMGASASLMGDMRIATTAALGAGTKTFDAHDVGLIATHSSAGVGAAAPIIGSIYLPVTDLVRYDIASGEHPIIFGQNEGIVVRATVPATGVWNIGIGIKWIVVTAF